MTFVHDFTAFPVNISFFFIEKNYSINFVGKQGKPVSWGVG
jgi:hypothetical protein